MVPSRTPPGLFVLALVATLVASTPTGATAKTSSKGSTSKRTAQPSSRDRVEPAPPAKGLQKARAELAALKKDPAKRRYRHNWEKVIHSFERAARGPDTAPALLEAARARYALYRFSLVESDREAALKLAGRARKAGSPEAATLAAAIRREAGDEPHPQAVAKAPKKAPAAVSPPPSRKAAPVTPHVPPVSRPAPSDDEEADDPVLAEAVARPATSERSTEPAVARVTDVESWSSSQYSRVALYLSRPVTFERREIAASAGHPRRIEIDVRPAVLSGPATDRPVEDAVLHRVRVSQGGADTVRVVLELKGAGDYQIFPLAEPARLIVDVGGREPGREAVARASPASQPAPALAPARPVHPSTASPPPTRPPIAVAEPAGEGEEDETVRRPVRRIIVDAGHGGHDTGAIGARGVREKDVTLAMSKRLAATLRSKGFEVTLTRSDDRYVKLEERTAIANMARGDLFVSIHANAHPRRDRNGVETYFLNVTDDRYARRLAARENGAIDLQDESNSVQRILTDLDAKASAGSSRKLAGMVQKELTSRARESQGPVRDLGVKSALFYVLLGARMPAVLVETAFISNRDEERRLSSPAYQQMVADGVASAVIDYAGQVRVASR